LQEVHEKYNWLPTGDEVRKSFTDLERRLAHGDDEKATNDQSKCAENPQQGNADNKILTITRAIKLATDLGYHITASTIYDAARKENIRDARKFGRDWVFKKVAFLYWIKMRYSPKKLNNN